MQGRRASKRLAGTSALPIVPERRLLAAAAAAAAAEWQSPKRIRTTRKPMKPSYAKPTTWARRIAQSSLSQATDMATAREPSRLDRAASASASSSRRGPERPKELVASRAGHLEPASNQMELIKAASRAHNWHWNETDKSHEVSIPHSARKPHQQTN